MSVLEPELYVCYHCKAESLKITIYSYSMFNPLIFRTDGYCTNHPVHTDDDLVMWCPHCEKFVIGKDLKRGRDKTKAEREGRFKKGVFNFFITRKKYFPGSKKYMEELRKSKAAQDVEDPHELRWFAGMHSCEEIVFALQSPELQNEEDIRYKLRLSYWRKNNHDDYGFDDQSATEEIYKKLMLAWEEQTDERYLFKAEMLRNMGEFKESNELLKNPLPQYEAILKKHKKWVRVIRTLNGLKYKKSLEINI